MHGQLVVFYWSKRGLRSNTACVIQCQILDHSEHRIDPNFYRSRTCEEEVVILEGRETVKSSRMPAIIHPVDGVFGRIMSSISSTLFRARQALQIMK